MSERGYFSLRYAIPGYTFILVVLGLNFIPVYQIMKLTEMASVSGGILALLSGSTIGFLINQSWWWWFERGKIYEFQPIKNLATNYGLEWKNELEHKRKLRFVYDYVLFSGLHSKEEYKGLSQYAFRRWDMYILLSCTKVSLILGMICGLLFRVFVEIFFLGMRAFSSLVYDFWFFLNVKEFWIITFILTSCFLLIYFIWQGQESIKFQYQSLHKIVITESVVKKAKLREVFPEYFRKDSTE